MKLWQTMITVTLAACSFTGPLLAENQTKRPPNVVFIMADDLGWGELGSYGQRKIMTPNIDKLASQGMRFTQHYSGSAVCAPARCVLMTAKHGGHAFIRNNGEVQPEGQRPIPASEVTMAELFKHQGYVTGAFGKWGLGFPGSEGDPLNQGFDRFFGYNCQRHAHSYYPDYLWSDDQRIPLDNNPPVPGHANLPKDADPKDPKNYEKYQGSDYAPDRINEQVLAFIRDHKDEPFFCYYPTVIPHLALHVPQEELEPYLAKGWKESPLTSGGYTPHATPRAAYAAMITRLDRYVGNVMNLLDELGLAENTIVVFTSDNGATHIGKAVDVQFFESVAGLRGLKGSLYEGGIRVPCIVRWPGKVEANSKSNHISVFQDWMPTLMELTGAEEVILPEGIDGLSMAPTLLGEADNQKQRDYIYWEFQGYGGQQAVRMGNWKALRQNINKGNTNLQLYDLADNPAEQHNVAEDHPDIIAKMEQIMAKEHVPSEAFPLKAID